MNHREAHVSILPPWPLLTPTNSAADAKNYEIHPYLTTLFYLFPFLASLTASREWKIPPLNNKIYRKLIWKFLYLLVFVVWIYKPTASPTTIAHICV